MSYSEQIAGLYVSPYLANKLAKFIGVNLQDDFSFVEKYRKNKSRIESFGDEFAYEHKFNSLGCRGAEPNIDSNNLRVLTLGDSFTEGVGAPVDSTWPHLLSKRIADFFDVGVSYLNGGTSGSDPFQNYYFLERNVDFFRPDLVVLVINHSDILDMYYRGNERFAGGKAMSYKWGPWWEPIYALSYIFRLAVQARGGMDMSFIRYDESFEVKLNSLNLISQVVKDKFNVLSEEKDFEFWIFFVPYQHDYLFDSKEFYFFDSIMSGNNVNYKGLKEDVRLYASSNGVTTQDLYWKKDMHPNSKGYYMLSKLIFDEILSNGRLGRRIDARKKLN